MTEQSQWQYFTSSVFHSLWTAGATLPYDSCPYNFWFWSYKGLYQAQLHTGWLANCWWEKSYCPDEDNINPPSPFSWFWLRATTCEGTAPLEKAVAPRPGPSAEAVMGQFWSLPLFWLVIGNKESWSSVSMKSLVLPVSLPVFTPHNTFWSHPSYLAITLQNHLIPQKPLFQLFSYQKHTNAYRVELQTHLFCLCPCLTSLLQSSSLIVQNCDVACWLCRCRSNLLCLLSKMKDGSLYNYFLNTISCSHIPISATTEMLLSLLLADQCFPRMCLPLLLWPHFYKYTETSVLRFFCSLWFDLPDNGVLTPTSQTTGSWSTNFIASFQTDLPPISGMMHEEIWLGKKDTVQAVCSLRSPSPFISGQGNINQFLFLWTLMGNNVFWDVFIFYFCLKKRISGKF